MTASHPSTPLPALAPCRPRQRSTLPALLRRCTAGVLLATVAASAAAHVTLEQPQAPAGSSYKAVLRVSHACSGARSTTAITARLPEGLRGAKPMPKAGWTLTTRRAPLAKPYQTHGRTVSEDVVEIRWQAQGAEQALPADQYDEFVFRAQLPDSGGPLWLRVLQSCDVGEIDWAQQPASGTATRGLDAPAVLLEVKPADGHAGHQH